MSRSKPWKPRRRDTYVARSRSSGIPVATLWRRDRGMPTRKDKAAKQQYLSTQEEEALEKYLLQAADNGYHVPARNLRSFAQVIARQRTSIFCETDADNDIKPPGKNWPPNFLKRHPRLLSKSLRTIDDKRHDHNIYDKIVDWFTLIGPQLQNSMILAENVYNMDETGVQLSVPQRSMKMLIDRDQLKQKVSRRAGVQRTQITAVECISANGEALPPLIVWPACTHRENWTSYPTPDWHFALSSSGYVDSQISLHWIQHVFDPLTRSKARGKPRVLVNDGFATHESLEVLTFCFQNNIVLCRLPSHTSHKLQPLDVGVFAPLKAAYRDQVERLGRGGEDNIGKQHFTELYSAARNVAFTPRIIKSAFAKSGLWPLDPDRVLRETQKPPVDLHISRTQGSGQSHTSTGERHDDLLPTPVTSESLEKLCARIEEKHRTLDVVSRHELTKLANSAKKSIAERDILAVDNNTLTAQHQRKEARSSIRSTVVGTAKVMSYEDIVAARRKREEKEAGKPGLGGRSAGTPAKTLAPSGVRKSRLTEASKGK